MMSLNAKLNVSTSESSAQPIAQKVKGIERLHRQLSTGQLAPTAADAPSTLTRSIRLQTHMRSAFQARLNLNQSASLAQTAEAHLSSIMDPLFRLSELAVQGMSETLSSSDRAILQHEAQELITTMKGEVDRSFFNGHSLFKGSFLQQSTLGLGQSKNGTHLLSLPKIDFEDHAFSIPDIYSDQDIVIALDATGSMQSAIDALAEDLGSFVSSLARDYKGDVRVSFVVYTDGNSITKEPNEFFEVLPFKELRNAEGQLNSDELDEFTTYLNDLNTSGGFEDIKGVVEYVDQNFEFREGANQQIVVIGSAGDEANDRPGAVSATEDFINGAPYRTLSTISVNGTSSYFKNQLSTVGGGAYLEYNNSTDLATQLTEAIASERTISGVDMMTNRGAEDAWFWADDLMKRVDLARANVAGFQRGLEQQISLREAELSIGEGRLSRLSSADVAELSTRLTQDQSTLRSGVAMRSEMINTFGGALLDLVDSLA